MAKVKTPRPAATDNRKTINSLASRLSAVKEGEKIVALAVNQVTPNPKQHRRHFDAEELRQLAASIVAGQQEQPIVVRPNPNDGPPYMIVSGERRWRACVLAKLPTVNAVIRQLSPDDADKIIVSEAVENWQRANLRLAESVTLATDLVGQLGLPGASERVGKPKSLLSRLCTIGKAGGAVAEAIALQISDDSQAMYQLTLLEKEDPKTVARLMTQWKTNPASRDNLRAQIETARKRLSETPSSPAKPGDTAVPSASRSGVSSATHTDSGRAAAAGNSDVVPTDSAMPKSVGVAGGRQSVVRGRRDGSADAAASSTRDQSERTVTALRPVGAHFEDSIVRIEIDDGSTIHFDRAALTAVLGLDA